MASLIYDNMLDKWARGNIDWDTDSFKVMLTTSAYTEAKATHTFRSDVTNEVSGTGYKAAGNTATITLNLNTTTHVLTITLGGTTWTTSTITARKAVYYKARGGASSADELVAVNDFGSDVVTSAGTFTLNSSSITVTN